MLDHLTQVEEDLFKAQQALLAKPQEEIFIGSQTDEG